MAQTVKKPPAVQECCVLCLVAQSVRLSATPWTVARQLLCPWDSPGNNTGVGCHAFHQGIFPTQGSNPGLLSCRQILDCLSDQAIQETRVQSLGWEVPLEKEMTTQSNIPAWRIPWTEGATVHVDTVLGVTESEGTEQLTLGLVYIT